MSTFRVLIRRNREEGRGGSGERGLVSPKIHHERGRSPPQLSRWVIVAPSTKPGTDLLKESLKEGMIAPIGVVIEMIQQLRRLGLGKAINAQLQPVDGRAAPLPWSM